MLEVTGGRVDRRRPRRASGALALAVALVATALGPTAPAGAQDEATPVDLATTAPVDTPGIDAVLDATPVEATPALRRAEDALDAAVAAQVEAQLRFIDAQRTRQDRALRSADADATVRGAEATLADAQAQLERDAAELARRKRTEDRLRQALAVEQERLRALAASLLATVPGDQWEVLGTFDDFTEADRRDAARDRGVDLQSEAVEAARVPWADARGARRAQQRRTDRAEADAADALEALATARDDRDHAAERLAEAEAAARTAQGAFDGAREAAVEALADRRAARLSSPVDGAALELVALHAYWRAAQLAPCRIPWWLIAGVGRVESGHGTAFGSSVSAEGDTTVRIIGIPLDGRPGTQAVGDTDGGRLDGDGTWDRAVGPMQFLPGTWGALGRDGNGDGTADPHNLYDAAAAAAGLLCLAGPDLTTAGAQRAALLRYNRSVPYGSKVLAEGGGYRDALELPEVPPRPGEAADDD